MKRELIGANVGNLVSFMKDVCENTVLEIPFEEDKAEIFITLSSLYRAYDDWCRSNDTKGRKNSRETLHEPMETCFGLTQQQGPRQFRRQMGFLLNREALLPHFQEVYKREPVFEFVIAL